MTPAIEYTEGEGVRRRDIVFPAADSPAGACRFAEGILACRLTEGILACRLAEGILACRLAEGILACRLAEGILACRLTEGILACRLAEGKPPAGLQKANRLQAHRRNGGEVYRKLRESG